MDIGTASSAFLRLARRSAPSSSELDKENARRARSGRGGGEPRGGLLHNRQIDERREQSEQDRDPPDGIVRTGFDEQEPAEPNAKKAPDLVAEEGKPEQGGEPAGAEHDGDQRRRRRYR